MKHQSAGFRHFFFIFSAFHPFHACFFGSSSEKSYICPCSALLHTIKNQNYMKQITSFNIARLRVEEDFGFLKLVVVETDCLISDSDSPDEISVPAASTPVTLTTSIATFKSAVDTFDNALKDSATVPSSAIAAEADTARKTAAEVKTLFDKYGDPTALPQTEESGILHNLLQDLKAIDNGKLASIFFEAWLTNLDACEEAFLAAVSQRTEEEAARQVGIVKESRQAADTAYRSLTGLVNALAVVNGDEAYATFIDRVNVLIDWQKTVLKARATNNRKKEEERPPVV